MSDNTLKRFNIKEIHLRNQAAGLESAGERVYTEAELDELYETNPLEAMRISRAQEAAKRNRPIQSIDPTMPPPDREALLKVLDEARKILLKDGGDMELVEIKGSIVRVRMKGNCVGCPNSVLDLKNVVERMVKQHFPQVTEVVNKF